MFASINRLVTVAMNLTAVGRLSGIDWMANPMLVLALMKAMVEFVTWLHERVIDIIELHILRAFWLLRQRWGQHTESASVPFLPVSFVAV
jgi:hypothetical protein